MTFADLFNNLLESSRERIKNQLFSSIFYSFILFNWRPIIFLLFSNKSIEEKINIVNEVYCYPLALLLPILFGIIYTNYVPLLMVFIDKNLEEPKKEKIENLYIYKNHKIDKQITLAEKEFHLKNIESGNKDREEMINERDSLINERDLLRHQILENNNSNAEIIKELNTRINSMRTAYQELVDDTSKEKENFKQEIVHNIRNTNMNNFWLRSLINLSKEDIDFAKQLKILKEQDDIDVIIDTDNPNYYTYDINSINRLIEQKVLKKHNDDELYLTNYGQSLLNKISEINYQD